MEPLSAGELLSRGRDLLSHELFRGLSIAPSQPVSTRPSQVIGPGIKAIEELLLAGNDLTEGLMPQASDGHAWLCQKAAIYFRDFHLRWPVLNGPSFDVKAAASPLAISVCVVGVWSDNYSNPQDRTCALRVHEILLQRLLHRIVR
jgi:hypothetical protein